jgi:hypothetical protein
MSAGLSLRQHISICSGSAAGNEQVSLFRLCYRSVDHCQSLVVRLAVGNQPEKLMPVTPKEEKQDEIVLALLREYSTAQEELSRAEAALIDSVVKDTRDKGWASLVHHRFQAENKVVATKVAARKAWEAHHLKKKG